MELTRKLGTILGPLLYDLGSEPGLSGWDVQVVIPSSQKSWIGSLSTPSVRYSTSL